MAITLTNLDLPGVTSAGQTYGADFSPSGALLALAHASSPYVSIYATAGWSKLPNPASLPAGASYGAAFSPDGALLAIAHANSPYITRYSTADWSKLPNPASLPSGACYGAAFSPDGSLLAVVHGSSPYLTVYNTADWSKLPAPTSLPAGACYGAAFSPDGSLLAVVHGISPYLTVYNTADWSKLTNPAVLPTGTGTDVAFSKDGALLAISHTGSPYVTTYNTADWSKVADPAVKPSNNGRSVAFSKVGALFAVTHDAWPYLTCYDTTDWSKLDNPASLPTLHGRRVAISPSGGLLAVGYSASPYVSIYEVAGDAPLADAVTLEWPVSVIYASRELPWAVSVFDGFAWQVTVQSAGQDLDLPWPVAVGVTAAASAAWPVTVLDAAAVGGLNGAGGWSAAPDGRWMAVVILDEEDISSRIVGAIEISRADDEAAVADFAFKPAATVQPMAVIGRRVRIAFAQQSDSGPANVQLMFSGVVDVPQIDALTGVIRCSCTDQLQEIFTNTARDWIDSNVGGRWHEAVSGVPEDNWAYLQARLKSVAASIALDARQRPHVLPWRDGLPRTVAIGQADIIDGSLAIELPSRDQLRTRITCRMQYRYPRLRARGIVAAWAQPFSFFAWRDVSGAMQSRLWLTTAMIHGAADNLPGWSLTRPIQIEHPRPDAYLTSGIYDGAYIITPEVAPDLALSFRANYATRWVQSATESYAITLTLPALEASLGTPVGEELGANLEAEFAQKGDWTSDEAVLPAVSAPSVGDSITAWQPAGQDAAARDEALRTLLDHAWVRLWSASRTGRVHAALPLRPDLWLDTWASLDTDKVRAAGKLAEITHRMDTSTGQAVTQISIAVGLPGNESASMPQWSLPAPPTLDTSRPPASYSVEIGTFIGGEFGRPPFDEQTMIGFATNNEAPDASPGINWYPHQLSMRAPDIDASDRDPAESTAELIIETAIPTDILEIDPT